MRHLRPVPALLALALIGAACSSPGASSGGDSQAAQQSQGGSASQGGTASQGSSASQPAASTSGGGGGGGGGANGSIHYEISGDIAKTGDLPFVSHPASTFSDGGWVAYFFTDSDPNVIIQINSVPSSNIFNYGDGSSLVIGTQATGCTFNYSRNDSGGLKGSIDCPAVIASNTAGATLHVKVHATVDAHT